MLGPIPGNIEFECLFYFPKFAAGRKSGLNLLVSGFRKIISETLRQVKSKRIIWRLDRTPASCEGKIRDGKGKKRYQWVILVSIGFFCMYWYVWWYVLWCMSWHCPLKETVLREKFGQERARRAGQESGARAGPGGGAGGRACSYIKTCVGIG